MEYKLNIFHKGTLMNTFYSKDPFTVCRQFTKCMLAKLKSTNEKIRVVRTPYVDRMKITMTWPECYGVRNDYRYEYEFKGLDELK